MILFCSFRFKNLGSQIVSNLLKEGILTIDQVVEKVLSGVKTKENGEEASRRDVHNVFVQMFEQGFVKPGVVIFNENPEPCWCWNDARQAELKIITEVPLLLDLDEPILKKRKKECKFGTELIYWCVNISQFHIYLRNNLIADTLKVTYGGNESGELVKIILHLSASSAKLSNKVSPKVLKQEIITAALKKNLFKSKEEVEIYLKYLAKDASNRFVIKSEERAGSAFFSVNLIEVMDKLIQSCVASIVNDRFGANCARIFRLLCSKKLQQKQIEETAMIPAKDAKECTYNLFKDGLVKILQLPKQADYVPSGTLFIFHVDIEEVCRTLLQRCYQAITNSILRRVHENEKNAGLIERKAFIDAVISNLKMQTHQSDVERQIEELNQSLSSHDKELLEKLKNLSYRCELSELQVDETSFLLQTWLDINVGDS